MKGTILGVHIAAGVFWFGCVTVTGDHVDDRDDRLVLEDAKLGEARALSELEESLEALLVRLAPATVALLDAGSSSQARAATVAQRRGQLEALILVAACRTGIDLVRVTHPAVKKTFGIPPARPELRGLTADELGINSPPNWNHRAPAFAAALVIARGKEVKIG